MMSSSTFGKGVLSNWCQEVATNTARAPITPQTIIQVIMSLKRSTSRPRCRAMRSASQIPAATPSVISTPYHAMVNPPIFRKTGFK